MRIPYVIDNQNHLMVQILNALLAEHKGRSLDVATASKAQVIRRELCDHRQ